MTELADPGVNPVTGKEGKGTAEGEEVLALDSTVYEELKAAAIAAKSRSGSTDLLGAEKEKLDAFLYREARLLDGRRYRDWASLLTADFVYWIPGGVDTVDPRVEGAINFDDRRRILDRITLMETKLQWAQVPPSRTCRVVTNVEAFAGSPGTVHVRSNIVIWEYRERRRQSFVGWQEHELLTAAEPWRIRRKLIWLIDCDQPQGNNTFIL
ncbi:MAG: aromatic-ring-hydroxylating dioxygenase subunit beta [Xanthobacteraceae bacterium]|jgi:benzoate/toluate 1,2-dioxygenase beta subunit